MVKLDATRVKEKEFHLKTSDKDTEPLIVEVKTPVISYDMDSIKFSGGFGISKFNGTVTVTKFKLGLIDSEYHWTFEPVFSGKEYIFPISNGRYRLFIKVKGRNKIEIQYRE